MTRHMEFENRSGPRYLASLEVKAEWDEPTGPLSVGKRHSH
jgi:hypothetical protein